MMRFFEVIITIVIAWLIAVIAVALTKSDLTYALTNAYDFILAPVTSIGINDSSKIISPVLLLLVVIGLFIKGNLTRRIFFQLLSIIWVFFGFLYVAGVN